MFCQAFPVSVLKTHLVVLLALLFTVLTACNDCGVLYTLTKKYYIH